MKNQNFSQKLLLILLYYIDKIYKKNLSGFLRFSGKTLFVGLWGQDNLPPEARLQLTYHYCKIEIGIFESISTRDDFIENWRR